MAHGNSRLQFLITCAVSTTAITFGVCFSWPTAVVPKFYNNETDFSLTDAEVSWIVAISSLGYIGGSLASRFTSDRYGRRATILGSVLPIGIGVVLKLIAQEAWMLCLARLLWGFSGGMIGSVTTIYLAEISDKDLRGRLILGYRFMFSFGCLLAMAIGPSVDYRTYNYLIALLPICYFTFCWFIPETPYFFLKEGKINAAREILVKLTNIKDEEVLEERLSQMKSDVRKEMSRSGTLKEFLTGKQYRRAIIIVVVLEERLSQMKSDVRKEMSRSGTLKEFLTGKQYRRAIIIVVGLKLTQLMAGLHAIQQYLGIISQESKSGVSTSTALIIFGIVRFVVGILSSLLVDKLGRRPLMIYSHIGAAVVLAIVGAYFIINPDNLSSYSFIPFVGVILAIVISVLGFESVAYIIPAELFPLNIKSIAMTSVNIYSGLINFAAVKSYQPIKDLGGNITVFLFYAIASLTGAVFSYFFLPETKCKSLKQIQIELQGNFYDESSEKLQPMVINNIKVDLDLEDNELKVLNKV